MDGKEDLENVTSITRKLKDEIFDDAIDFTLTKIETHGRLRSTEVLWMVFESLEYIAARLGDDVQTDFTLYVKHSIKDRVADLDRQIEQEADSPMKFFSDDAA